MDDFELQLKRIPLAKPPRDMKRRIFGGPRIIGIFRCRVPLGWAALIALFAGLTGMYIQERLKGPTPPPSKVVVVQILEAPSKGNPFDFTEASTEFMPGELSVKVKPAEEI